MFLLNGSATVGVLHASNNSNSQSAPGDLEWKLLREFPMICSSELIQTYQFTRGPMKRPRTSFESIPALSILRCDFRASCPLQGTAGHLSGIFLLVLVPVYGCHDEAPQADGTSSRHTRSRHPKAEVVHRTWAVLMSPDAPPCLWVCTILYTRILAPTVYLQYSLNRTPTNQTGLGIP